MELKPGQLDLTLQEAKWIAGRHSIADDLRRRIEADRRRVLQPRMPNIQLGGIALISTDLTDFKIQVEQWLIAQKAMQVAAAAYPSGRNAIVHPVSVATYDGEVDELYKYARIANRNAIMELGDPAQHMGQDKVAEAEAVLDNSDSFHGTMHSRNVVSLNISTAIILEIERVREQP